MADLPTRLDLYATGRAYLKRTATKLDPAVIDIDGSDANIFVGSTSVVADKIVKQLGYSIARLLLDTSEGDDLDRFAYDRYRETRKGASPAVGEVRFFRLVAATGGSIPIGTRLKTATGIEYVTTSVASMPIGVFEATADVRAAQAGSITRVGRNAIRQFGDPSLLFDKTIQLTNDDPTAGGEDAEDDDTFKNRLRNFWLTARRGVLSAIVQGALSVPGVVSASAIEALSSGGLPARVVNLYIADSSGVASKALAKKVTTALDDYRAAGIAVIVYTSLPQLVDISLKLQFVAGVDTTALADVVRSAVVEFVNSLAVNAPLLVSDLYTVLKQYKDDGVIATKESILAPTGDLFPPTGQTLRTTIDRVVLG